MARLRFLVLSMLGLMACDSTPLKVSKPPPLPPLPSLGVPAKAEPGAEQEPKERPDSPAQVGAAKRAPDEKSSTKSAPTARRAPLPPSPPARPAAPAPPTSPPPSQQPQIIATTPKPATASKVSVPKTVHVAIDVPAGLQAELDRDPRMQPWVNQVVATIDRCYGSESKSHSQLVGTIEVLVTMHENERPDADIKQLPPALSPIAACATGGLMRTKMPLFTGKEGSRYTVKVRFSR